MEKRRVIWDWAGCFFISRPRTSLWGQNWMVIQLEGRKLLLHVCSRSLLTQSVFMIHQYHLEIVGNAVRSCWGSSETFLNQSWLTGTVSECRSLPGDHGDIKKVSIAEIPSHWNISFNISWQSLLSNHCEVRLKFTVNLSEIVLYFQHFIKSWTWQKSREKDLLHSYLEKYLTGNRWETNIKVRS